MPLTPDANLIAGQYSYISHARSARHILNKFLGLDIVHAVHTRDTIPERMLVLSSLYPNVYAYPTERTRPVSARPASSCTPRIRCSRMEDTSVGDAFASAA